MDHQKDAQWWCFIVCSDLIFEQSALFLELVLYFLPSISYDTLVKTSATEYVICVFLWLTGLTLRVYFLIEPIKMSDIGMGNPYHKLWL
jgi:hypothetical protein